MKTNLRPFSHQLGLWICLAGLTMAAACHRQPISPVKKIADRKIRGMEDYLFIEEYMNQVTQEGHLKETGEELEQELLQSPDRPGLLIALRKYYDLWGTVEMEIDVLDMILPRLASDREQNFSEAASRLAERREQLETYIRSKSSAPVNNREESTVFIKKMLATIHSAEDAENWAEQMISDARDDVLPAYLTAAQEAGYLSREYCNRKMTIVAFRDKALEAGIRDALSQPEGVLHVYELESLGELNLRDRGISSLEGIQFCRNLSKLNIAGNEIQDLAPLGNLVELETLICGYYDAVSGKRFYNPDISDLSPLADLRNLKSLRIPFSQVKDISALAGMTKLHYLDFYLNKIEDISPLAGLKELKVLILGSNRITDISMLKDLRKLIYFSVNYNRIEDISVISHMPDLVLLGVVDTGITSINLLKNHKKLGNLAFARRQIKDEIEISYIDSGVYDDCLQLSGNRIKDIRILEKLYKNRVLTRGDVVLLEDNRLDISPESENRKIIDKLENAGITVAYRKGNNF